MLAGPLAGTKARLSGFNTLESFGPVHQWGTWTAKELYALAKVATLHARRGEWRCLSDMAKDGYGRTLWWCEDLARSLIKEGLAHAMTIDEAPAAPALVAAQREAIKARRGIWAHGVPNYVLTSIHSNDERPGDEASYNRLISTVDGHSRKWTHREVYAECDQVCFEQTPAEAQLELAQRLKTRTGLPAEVAAADLVPLLSGGAPPAALDPAQAAAAQRTLAELRAEGWLDAAASPLKACMVHTDYRRRFGARKAACLR